MSDESSIVDSIQQESRCALEAAIREYGGRMLSVARQLLQNEQDAQDAVQDAFLTAFRCLNQFVNRSSLATWLHRIVINAALMRRRLQSRHRAESLNTLLPAFLADGHEAHPTQRWTAQSLSKVETDETRSAIRHCIDQLPETYRTALLLRDIQELDTAAVASLLEISPDAVKVQLHRARQALKTLLELIFGSNDR